MFSHRTDVAECIINTEILDWFKKLAKETCHPDVDIQYKSYDAHFNSHTYVKISGRKSQIDHAVEFIRDTSEILNFKMPWLNGNVYYVRFDEAKATIEEKLTTMMKTNLDFYYTINTYNMLGVRLTVFHFRPRLDDTNQMKINDIFRSLVKPIPLFLSYPKTNAALVHQSSSHMATNMLTALDGKFLPYLNLEDILSLEIANKEYNAICDMALEHDIQKFLQDNYPDLYGEKEDTLWHLKDFTINEVLCYFIKKYHANFQKLEIPNILNADEIQAVKNEYGIEIVCHNIIHIDFKATNEFENIDFCTIHHYDPNNDYFTNYGPNYAVNNYSVNFNDYNAYDLLDCGKEFSVFVLKSQNKCSSAKLNTMVNYVITYFKACEDDSLMILLELDLNHVSAQNIKSLLKMMRRGRFEFEKINFNLRTLLLILGQANENEIVFRKCDFDIENIKPVSNNSPIEDVLFIDMDVELRLFNVLSNIGYLVFRNCNILCTNWEVPIIMENSNDVWFTYTNFKLTTLLKVLYGLQHIRNLNFLSCNFTSDYDLIERKNFSVETSISFNSMYFNVEIVFQILENCEIRNRIVFDSCHFNCDSNATYKFLLQPVELSLDHTKFELSVLFTILEVLNPESVVFIDNSYISDAGDISSTQLQLELLQFTGCRLKIQTLLTIVWKMAETSKLYFIDCDLLNSSVEIYPNILKNLTGLQFRQMEFTSQHLFAILGVLNKNGLVSFTKCNITEVSGQVSNLNVQQKINIYFDDMTIDTNIARELLQTDSKISFENCYCKFLTDPLFDVAIQSNVEFFNMTFHRSAHLKFLEKFVPNSVITIRNCDIELTNTTMPNIVIKSQWIFLERIAFDFEILIRIMERISENTRLIISECNIPMPIRKVFSIRPIQIPIIMFESVNLETYTILSLLENFAKSLEILNFSSCKIVNSNLEGDASVELSFKNIQYDNMDIDISAFQTMVQKCACAVTVCIENCTILPPVNGQLSTVMVKIDRLVLKGVKYSSELLQLFQHLNGDFIVEYHDPLPNRAIFEICIETAVHGKRLHLFNQTCTKLIYFELFAEFFRSRVLNLRALDMAEEYNLPTDLVPEIDSISNSDQFDWTTIKIKPIPNDDTSVKLEFFRNDTQIDLFFELNDLSDDSDQYIVDHS